MPSFLRYQIGYPEPMKWLICAILALLMVPAFSQYNNKPVSPAEEKKNIAKLLANHAKAKAAFVKAPKDVKVKKSYVQSNVALGYQYTYSATVDRKEKYKIALKYLREALKHDPKNKDARTMHDQIVSIYKSMGRPVPGDKG
jgi:tetratricopeptide (TPR) repeat protein